MALKADGEYEYTHPHWIPHENHALEKACFPEKLELWNKNSCPGDLKSLMPFLQGSVLLL